MLEEEMEPKPKVELKKKSKKSDPDGGEIKVNPMFNISDIGNKIKARRKIRQTQERKEKGKINLFQSFCEPQKKEAFRHRNR